MKVTKDLSKILALTVIGGATLGGCGSSNHNNKVPTVHNPITQTNKAPQDGKSSFPTTTNTIKANEKASGKNSKDIKKIDENSKENAQKIAKKAKLEKAKKDEATRKANEKIRLERLKNSQNSRNGNGGGGLHSTYNTKGADGAKYYSTAPANGGKYRDVAKSTKITARPVSVTISAIGVRNATILARGLTGGILSPVPGYIQWYTGSPKPGDKGISVLAGHVTYNGPDVLYNLGRTPIGAKITVHYSNGLSKTFTVKRRGTVNKNTLRYDQTVWGHSSTPKLVVISCDKNSAWAGLHHVNNYIVWAE